MRALVTGAAGFIGSHLCRRLVADGHDVVGFDDMSDGRIENLEDVPEVHLIRADLRDEDAVRSAARGCKIILHQGAKRSVPRSFAMPGETTDTNVRGTLNVLLAAKEVGASAVVASSSSVYGDQETFPLREDLVPRPRSPYAASKLSGEVYVEAMARGAGVPAVALRYFNVYGPGQDPASEYAAVIPRFIRACVDGRPAEIHGDGEQSRDFTFIDDVVDANLLAARAPDDAVGRAFNIGGGERPTTINEILSLVGEALGVEPTADRLPSREGDVRRTEADLGLARRLLGFEPKVEIREGIRRTVAAYVEA